jgi:hypothetical protein
MEGGTEQIWQVIESLPQIMLLHAAEMASNW